MTVSTTSTEVAVQPVTSGELKLAEFARRRRAQAPRAGHRDGPAPRRLRVGVHHASASSSSWSRSRSSSSSTSRCGTSSPTRSGRRCSPTRISASCRCCRARSPAPLVALSSRSRSARSSRSTCRSSPAIKMREIAEAVLELLGGVPTIVYGYFALLFVTPLLQKIYPELPGFNMLSAGIVMGIMIIPYVSSLSEDAMRAVPMSLREGSYAMGATRFQTAIKVVVPAALSGHRRGLHPRHLARGRRDDDPRGRRRHAAEPHAQPAGAGGDDHRLHRAGGARRPAARQHRLPDDLRRRPDADAADAGCSTCSATCCAAVTGRPTDERRHHRDTTPSCARIIRRTSAGT